MQPVSLVRQDPLNYQKPCEALLIYTRWQILYWVLAMASIIFIAVMMRIARH